MEVKARDGPDIHKDWPKNRDDGQHIFSKFDLLIATDIWGVSRKQLEMRWLTSVFRLRGRPGVSLIVLDCYICAKVCPEIADEPHRGD